jgi:hypothetical protein
MLMVEHELLVLRSAEWMVMLVGWHFLHLDVSRWSFLVLFAATPLVNSIVDPYAGLGCSSSRTTSGPFLALKLIGILLCHGIVMVATVSDV